MFEYQIAEAMSTRLQQILAPDKPGLEYPTQEVPDDEFLAKHRIERGWATLYKGVPIVVGVNRKENTIRFITPDKTIEAEKFDVLTDEQFNKGINNLVRFIEIAYATAPGFQQAGQYEALDSELPKPEIVPESSPELDEQRAKLAALFNMEAPTEDTPNGDCNLPND